MESAAKNETIYEFDGFRLVEGEELLLRNGERIPLNIKSFGVLKMLVERHGHLVTKSEIIDTVWEDAFVEESSLTKAIWMIRHALDDTSKERFIQTVPKRGYRFVFPVRIATEGSGAFRLSDLRALVEDDEEVADVSPSDTYQYELAAAAAASSDLTEPIATAEPTSISGPHSLLEAKRASWPLKRSVMITTAAAAGLAALLYLTAFRPALGPAENTARSIAVLPLKPIDPANRNDLYEIGTADALIQRLSSIEGFVVRPLGATRKYVDLHQDALAAGRELKVDFVVTANYQIADGRMKVTSQFLDVATGKIVESFSSATDSANILAAQDVIADDIGKRFLARFGSDEAEIHAKRGTSNEEAYRYYLMAMNLSDERGVQNVLKSLEHLEKAVALDPSYARAWAAKAHIHGDIVGHSAPNPHEHFPKAKEAIRKALSIDPYLSEAYSALCNTENRYDYNPVAAETACKRALELDPKSSLARVTYANFLYTRGRFDEALTEVKKAIDLQPVSFRNQQTYGLTLYYARRYAAAQEQFERLLELSPNHNWIRGRLVLVMERQGKESEALEYLVEYLTFQNKDQAEINRLKSAFRNGGWLGVLIEQLKIAESESRPNYFQLACLSAKIGSKEKAFEYLEKALQDRSFLMAIIQVEPQLDSLRDDPRFDDLVRRLERK